MVDARIEQEARARLAELATLHGLDVAGGKVRRTSSRFCLGVEHGDYNGTELFGVGTDRFIWVAYKPNGTDTMRLVSHNFLADGVVSFACGSIGAPTSDQEEHSWARFPRGVDYVLKKYGYAITQGMDAVVFGNIPGGGMSRSASLTINLVLDVFDVNGIAVSEDMSERMKIVDLSQAVETEYVGAPCGNLDQIMIYFAKEGYGTHYKPAERSVEYVPLGKDAKDFAIVSLDTGTLRPGLEKSTYKVRRSECDALAEAAGAAFGIKKLGDVTDEALLQKILDKFEVDMPGPCQRLKYIYHAQQRFYEMMEAWKSGDIARVGAIFREDGRGLRDVYSISGPELETMCDIVRTVPGVLGERMLGGGDKGAAGALVLTEAVEAVRTAVDTAYPRSRPDYRTLLGSNVGNGERDGCGTVCDLSKEKEKALKKRET